MMHHHRARSLATSLYILFMQEEAGLDFEWIHDDWKGLSLATEMR